MCDLALIDNYIWEKKTKRKFSLKNIYLPSSAMMSLLVLFMLPGPIRSSFFGHLDKPYYYISDSITKQSSSIACNDIIACYISDAIEQAVGYKKNPIEIEDQILEELEKL